MEKNKFINLVSAAAVRGYIKYHIFASVTIAQAILESAWGESGLSKDAKNLFGIKATAEWNGKVVSYKTCEYIKGERCTVSASFKAYNSYDDSLEDHLKLLLIARYAHVRISLNYKEACINLHKCGYATDINYANKLIQIIEENELYKFDTIEYLENFTSMDCHIRNFQKLCNDLNILDYKDEHLVEDNLLGPRTRSCIPKMPCLMKGSKGLAVKYVQEIVRTTVDGSFGPLTRKAVMDYQNRKKLKIDGIVGINTWRKIVES
ncbi:MAG: glucosaminidase domain-containing protein [Clostridiaceae bacterium]